MDDSPNSYVSSSVLLELGINFDALVEHSAFLHINEVARNLFRDMGVHNKARCGCVVRLDHDAKNYVVVTKVIAGGSFFMHEEPWREFPSDHFKTKVLLLAG